MDAKEVRATYLWNEHTWLMSAIEPAIEELFPHVWRWFELQDADVALRLKAQGHAVYNKTVYYWLGIPRGEDVDLYLVAILA